MYEEYCYEGQLPRCEVQVTRTTAASDIREMDIVCEADMRITAGADTALQVVGRT